MWEKSGNALSVILTTKRPIWCAADKESLVVIHRVPFVKSFLPLCNTFADLWIVTDYFKIKNTSWKLEWDRFRCSPKFRFESVSSLFLAHLNPTKQNFINQIYIKWDWRKVYLSIELTEVGVVHWMDVSIWWTTTHFVNLIDDYTFCQFHFVSSKLPKFRFVPLCNDLFVDYCEISR